MSEYDKLLKAFQHSSQKIYAMVRHSTSDINDEIVAYRFGEACLNILCRYRHIHVAYPMIKAAK